jgi:hypothetical protein
LTIAPQVALLGNSSPTKDKTAWAALPPHSGFSSEPCPIPVVPPKPKQSEAVTLLATLQREARLIDFLKEDLSGYADEQIGAAVREIHRDAGQTLERMFGIRPLVDDTEGAAVEVPTGFDAAQYRLTGQVAGSPPYRGSLQHHGWRATKSELPTFTGSDTAALTLAPAEVQID